MSGIGAGRSKVGLLGLAVAACLVAACKDDGGSNGSSGTEGTVGSTGGTGGTASDGTADETGTTSGGGVHPTDAILQLIEARCTWLFDCCATGELAFELGPFTQSAQDCVDRVVSVLESGSPGAPIGAGPSDLLLALTQSYALGRIEIDAAAVQACAEHVSSGGCTPILMLDDHCDPAESQPLDDPCALDVLAIGQQAVGDVCEPLIQAECVEGARCVDFGTSGVCAALATEGSPCFADSDCADPLVCDLAETGTCLAGAGIGQACSFADPENPIPGTEVDRCQRGLTCDPTDFVCVGGSCGPGAPCTVDQQCPVDHYCVFDSCQAQQGGGGPCTANEHCLSGFCSLGTNTCSAPSGQPDGSPCTSHFQCISDFCDPQALLCTPQKAPGESCPSNQDVECKDGYCDTTMINDPVCAAYSAEGEPCTTVSDCVPGQSLSCVNMVCSLLANGETCFSNAQCQSELCFQSVCDTPLSVGDDCGAAAMGRPCETGAFCDVPLGSTDGMCKALLTTGMACVEDNQCWGQCVDAWGEKLCDETPADGAAWCDGM